MAFEMHSRCYCVVSAVILFNEIFRELFLFNFVSLVARFALFE